MSASLGLDPLLTALREAGLPVGVSEITRLQHVFALEPQIEDREGLRLKAILRAVLVKSSEDQAVFNLVFDAWIGRSGQELSLHAVPASEPQRVEAPRKAPLSLPPRRSFWRIFTPIVLILASLWLGEHGKNSPELKISSSQTRNFGMLFTHLLTPAEIRTRTFTAWVPTLTITPANPRGQGGLNLILGGLALLAAIGLWLALRRRRWLPDLVAAEPLKKGPPRVFLTPPRLADPQFLEPREQEAIVWGIDQFVADESTRRIDLPDTVRKTAKNGGIPHLRFHQARHPREVWLWVDEATDDPAAQRLASEVEAVLRVQSLPVERALFRGIPDWLVTATGQAFAPNEVDERRDAALLAILTDGRVLVRQYAADNHRVHLDTLLRSLSRWRHLAIVDFSAPPSDLASILAKHSLLRIAPAELAAFLAGGESTQRKPPTTGLDDAAWAATCALAPASVDEARAFEFRRRLGLATSPWALQALRAEAPGPPGRLQWRSLERARRVNWLRETEAQLVSTVAPGSLLGKALDLWEEVYDREMNSRKAGASEGIWLGTPAQQHLAMERALLALWRDASNAVRQLYRLHSGSFGEIIRRHLHNLAPLDWGGTEHVHLPWPWSERSCAEQVMLQKMGLGGGMPVAELSRPGRFFLGLGICLGLAAGALAAAALSGWQQPGPPVVLHGPGKPAEAWDNLQEVESDWYFSIGTRLLVAVGTRKSLVVLPVPAGAQIRVSWEEQSLPCVEKLENGGEIWSCGTIETSSRLPQAIIRRVVVLSASPEAPEAADLAIDLLDSGSADQVILGFDSRTYSSQLLRHPPPNQEILNLPDSKWSTLRPALHFDGTRPLSQVWPSLRLLSGKYSALLRGLPTCRTGELLEQSGMTFVHVCPGTFTMGAADTDAYAEFDEKPAHQVILSESWIGRTEVTNAQYRANHPGDQGPDSLPATRVTWNEAKDFCERHGWRLPTEAEWEYAARAGTKTLWSFGADERRLKDFAWFKEDSGLGPHTVATRKPNPWGIYDMHGNVWEWVEDRIGPYKPGPQKDPKGTESGERRVMRGGAFLNSPGNLRSANREWNRPLTQDWFIGFRCARSPLPKP
ncbi:MAG TPA: SUMF1/EgtB/PvdO family nonheme iron enzyme [Thermoanaerobaculia bacterium]|nr:SUMF1/EgtB/PvdO family nonheme iron enzyme [Thermoanaerobaculia bacterium]